MLDVRAVLQQVAARLELREALQEARRHTEGEVYLPQQRFFARAPVRLVLISIRKPRPLVDCVVDLAVGPDGPHQESRVRPEADRNGMGKAEPVRDCRHGRAALPATMVQTPAEQWSVVIRENMKPLADPTKSESASGEVQPSKRVPAGEFLAAPVGIYVQHLMPTSCETTHQLLFTGPAVIPVLLTEAYDLHRRRAVDPIHVPAGFAELGLWLTCV